MLTPEQRTQLDRRGYTLLPGAFDKSGIDAVADRVWTHLETHRGIRRTDPATWNISAPWAGLKALKDEPLFLSLDSSALCSAIDELLGSGSWHRPRHWGGFLVNFPTCHPDEWDVPHNGWHVDFHYTYEPGTPFGLRAFTFLSEVGPRGGGTLVLRGSHRLVERFVRAMPPAERQQGYAVLRERFNASHPWLAKLTAGKDPDRVARFMERMHDIDGVPVRVEQFCGSPGDVILTHPWMLHASAPNAGPGPRIMLGKTIYSSQRAEAAG